MLARSHVALALAPYLALLSHPLPVAVPVLGVPSGESAADPVVAAALSAGAVAVAALARVAGPASRGLAWSLTRLLKHRGPLHSSLVALLAGVVAALLGARLGVTGLGLPVGGTGGRTTCSPTP